MYTGFHSATRPDKPAVVMGREAVQAPAARRVPGGPRMTLPSFRPAGGSVIDISSKASVRPTVTALLLASDASSYMTGALPVLDRSGA